MYTSYFAKFSGKIMDFPPDRLMSIAYKAPMGFVGNYYPKLYPPWPLVQAYLKNRDWERFTGAYTHMVLKNLDPEEVYNEIGDESILLCWEGLNKPCHRRIVAKWFEDKLGVGVPEIA